MIFSFIKYLFSEPQLCAKRYISRKFSGVAPFLSQSPLASFVDLHRHIVFKLADMGGFGLSVLKKDYFLFINWWFGEEEEATLYQE